VLGHSFENETPYAQQWHLGVERELFPTMAVELTYAGSAGKHLLFCYNPNEVQPGSARRRVAAAHPAALEPVEHGAVRSAQPFTYHSGQLKVTQRFTSGLQFLVSYTYGKSLDYGGSAASGGGAVGNPQTVTNLAAGKGPSGFDVRHRAVISYVYELPWGPGRRWLTEAACSAPWSAAGNSPASPRSRPAGRPLFPRTGREQRRPELAESHRLRQAGQPLGGSVVQHRRFRGAASQHLR
jgi:hypothetical protein